MHSMMPSLAFKLMFLASAPVLLMPTFLALRTRRTGRAWIALGNLVLWGCLYLSLGSVLGTVGSGFLVGFPLRPGTVLSLIGWLVLLRFAIAGVSSRVDPEGVARQEVRDA